MNLTKKIQLINEFLDGDLDIDYGGGGGGNNHSELFNVFVQPFVDVLRTIKVASKDILRATKLNLDVMLTLSPSKIQSLLDSYDKDLEKIKKEYEVVMKNINRVMKGDDVNLLLFLLSPMDFIGSKLAQNLPGTVSNIPSYLAAIGFLPKLGAKSQLSGKSSSKSSGDSQSVLGKLAAKLTKIFFIAHTEHPGSTLTEASDNPSSSKAIESYLSDIGFLEQTEKASQAILLAKKTQIDNVLKSAAQKITPLKLIAKSTSMNEFISAVEKAKGSVDASAIKNMIKKESKKILNDPKAIEKIKKKIEGTPTEEKIQNSINSIIFIALKEELQQKIMAGIKNLLMQYMKVLTKDLPKDTQSLKKTKEGKQFLELIQYGKRKLFTIAQ